MIKILENLSSKELGELMYSFGTLKFGVKLNRNNYAQKENC